MKKFLITLTSITGIAGIVIIAAAALLFRKKEMNELLEME